MNGKSRLRAATLLLAIFLHPSIGSKYAESLDTADGHVQKEIVDLHNDLRRNVKPQAQNMLKMKWNEAAATMAETWAKRCTFIHSPVALRTMEDSTVCMEILYKANFRASWTHVINSWFRHGQNFTYGIGGDFPNAQIGQYTQIVWALTHQVGCHVGACGREYLYSCIYCPGGNDYTSMSVPYEVGPPCKRCPNNCDEGLCTNPCPVTNRYINCKDMKVDCLFDAAIKAGCKATCRCTTEIY